MSARRGDPVQPWRDCPADCRPATAPPTARRTVSVTSRDDCGKGWVKLAKQETRPPSMPRIQETNVTASTTADTFPRLLMQHAKVRPGATAIREKDLGIWQSWSWVEMLQEVREIAGRLAGRRGSGAGAPRHHRREPRASIHNVRGPVPGRRPGADVPGRRCGRDAFVFDNAEIRFAMVEDQSRWTRCSRSREVAHIKRIFYDDRAD